MLAVTVGSARAEIKLAAWRIVSAVLRTVGRQAGLIGLVVPIDRLPVGAQVSRRRCADPTANDGPDAGFSRAIILHGDEGTRAVSRAEASQISLLLAMQQQQRGTQG